MSGEARSTERALLDERVVAVVRHDSAEHARAIATSCLVGGLRAVEITFTTPAAAAVIADLVAEDVDGAVIGAGTVLRVSDVTAAAAAGARFLVSPVTDPDVLAAGRRAGLLTIPGALTPTEIGVARAHGARLVKLFPAGTVGPSFVTAIASVLPDVRLLPTGGVGEADVEAWLQAGAGAVGIGSQLTQAYAAGGPAAVEDLARRLARHALRSDLEPHRA
ncbi:MAG TPA: bifunctional 4-hydroxy-2-oxoglutarate aldolase/2-dehydro-3-deoxy-phosphogluconate aldolase [Egibacteraceae bacterium]